MTVPLPPPVPPMYLRFTISAAFCTLALSLLPFFLVGMLLRAVMTPFTNLYERWSSPKRRHKAPRRKPVAAAGAKQQSNGHGGATPPFARVCSSSSLRRVPMPRVHTDAQVYASSNRVTVTPPSPSSSMSSGATSLS